MNQFQNPFINNMNYMGNNDMNYPGNNNMNYMGYDDNNQKNNQGCGCNNQNIMPQVNNCCQNKPVCPTIYKDCPPIVTCSKQVIDQYHVIRQPYVHNYHTEVVHHHIVQNEFIPNYTCSEVHVNEPNNSDYPRN